MSAGARSFFVGVALLASVVAYGQSPAAESQSTGRPWEKQKARGRDEVLRGIESRARETSATVVQDVRNVMYDYEVDMYRLVTGIGKRYGMDTAYEIMSDTVADKRLRWMDQVMPELKLSGTEVEQGLGLYRRYFQPRDEEFKIIDQAEDRVTFRRKDYVNAISYACNALGLDPIEVNNKVYARAMTLMLQRVHTGLRHSFVKYDGDGWYEEVIQFRKAQ
jgi:hypothetical protein